MRRVCEESNLTINAISAQELDAYIGLLLLAGVFRSAGESLCGLWDDKDGRSIFRATMSLKRFYVINRFLTFDDKESRANRRRYDKQISIQKCLFRN